MPYVHNSLFQIYQLNFFQNLKAILEFNCQKFKLKVRRQVKDQGVITGVGQQTN